MKKYILFIVVILSIPIVLSLKTSLLTPSATFRVNYSDIINHYIEVRNDNNFSINIKILKPENIDIKFLNPTEFNLKPDESKIIDYQIKAVKNITDYINVIFEGEEKRVALQSKINIIVYNNLFKRYINISIIALLIIGLVISLLMLNKLFFNRVKGGKENNEKINDFNDVSNSNNTNGFISSNRSI